MRLLKLQIIVFAVAFLFGAIKGFSFTGADYQASFLLSLYATSISFVVAAIVSKVGVYQVIDGRDVKMLTVLSIGAVLVWAVLLGLHLHFGAACEKISSSCDGLKLRDFLIAGVVWILVPVFYLLRTRLLPKSSG